MKRSPLDQQYLNSLRARLKKYLADSGVTQASITKQINVSGSLINNFLNGRTTLSERIAELVEKVMVSPATKMEAPQKEPKKSRKNAAPRKQRKQKLPEPTRIEVTPIEVALPSPNVEFTRFLEPLKKLTSVLLEIQGLLESKPAQPREAQPSASVAQVAKAKKETKMKLDYEPLPRSRQKELIQQNRARARVGVDLIKTKIVQCLSCGHKFETTGNRMCSVCRKEVDYSVQSQGPAHY